MWASMDQKFDGTDWDVIFKTKQTVTTCVTIPTPPTGGSGQGGNTMVTAFTSPKLMKTLENLVFSGHKQKQEPLKPWDATTQTGAPDKLIERNTNKLDPSYFMTKDEMKMFNKELTQKNDGILKDSPYVLLPLTGHGYIFFIMVLCIDSFFSQKDKVPACNTYWKLSLKTNVCYAYFLQFTFFNSLSIV